MRLVIDYPADWPTESGPLGSYRVEVPSSGAAGDLTLRVASLVVRDDNLIQWTERVIGEELGAGVEILSVDDGLTELGWPTRRVLVKKGDARFLYRFYHLLDYGGQAVVEARDPDALEEQLERLDAMLLEARPDFTAADQVTALAQLWA